MTDINHGSSHEVIGSSTGSGPAVLECRGLTAGYGTAPAIRGISLSVGAGEVVAILGANGAGKTTTLLTLAGELPHQEGEVRYAGEVRRLPLYQHARRGLAFVTEERSAFMALTVRENLRLGHGGVAAVLAMVPELTPLLDRRVGLLSGGEQQMLTVARALAAKPSILFADELSLGLAPKILDRLLALGAGGRRRRGRRTDGRAAGPQGPADVRSRIRARQR